MIEKQGKLSEAFRKFADKSNFENATFEAYFVVFVGH